MYAAQLSGVQRIRRAIAAAAIGVAAVAGTAAIAAPAHAEVQYPASINQCLAAKPTLKEGVRNQGPCVAAVQAFLTYSYGNGQVDVDGKFGPKTKAAGRNFQRAVGIYDDGVIGPATWRSLQNACTAQGKSPEGNCDYRYPLPLPL
ncbi:peptidoglycan-binding domain-containing protein [Nocardia anaemiae]|uniref:peptidoglycan-binding domain-containing protein n=1 Tax=Nocardia anaemiae TaxID=263910 RepID=UPI0007A41420|nr:peptidoglycan-binding domain-containing protein [Nocardia anaemiae]